MIGFVFSKRCVERIFKKNEEKQRGESMNKETLQQYIYLEDKITALQEQKEMMQKTFLSVKQSDGMPHGNGVSDTVGKTVCKIDALEEKINEKIDELLVLKSEIQLFIMDLPSPYYEIMWKRYIEGKSCKVVANEMGYSERWFYEKQSEIMRKMAV